jgi:hypothetical protein
MTSLVIDNSQTSNHPYPTAVIYGKAGIEDITDPSNPIAIKGSVTIQVEMTDVSGIGTGDRIAITVWSKTGAVWFSSNWNGTKTIEQVVAAVSDIYISNKGSLNTTVSGVVNIEATAVMGKKAVSPNFVGKLEVTARPNPSNDQFILLMKSGSSKPVALRVIDLLGRVLESRTLPPNGSIAIGRTYLPGSYSVELLQGTDKVSVKLIKQPN